MVDSEVNLNLIQKTIYQKNGKVDILNLRFANLDNIKDINEKILFTTAINDNCIILNKDYLKQYQSNYSLIENKKNMPQNNCKEEPICIIKYNLSISNEESDIKQMLLEYLHIINIECFISNIKLFDSKNKCEIKSISDLLINNTQTCKIIITPIDCNKCNQCNMK